MRKFPGLTIVVLLTIFTSQIAMAGGMLFDVKTGYEDTTNSYNFSYQKNVPIRDHLVITNQDKNNPITIHLTGVDGLSNEVGQQYFRDSVEKQSFLGQWIKFKINDITLVPGGSQVVEFSINAPQDALPGIYGGGIAIEDVTPAAPPSNTGASGATTAFSVKVSTRLVKRVYLEIPGAVISDAEVGNLQFIENIDGKKYFTFDIKNTGNTLLSFKGNLTIEGGLRNDLKISLPIDIKSIQGNTSIQEQIAWPNSDNLWGNFNATLNLVASEYSPFNNTYKDLKTFNLHTSLQQMPWNYIIASGILLILIIILIIFVIVSKRNYLKHCEYYEVKAGDSLKSLAESHHMSWQKLAHINKLSPPYELKPNSKILVRKIDEKK